MNKFAKSVQENLLVLLAFDDENFSVARNLALVEYFDSFYKEIAEECVKFIDSYNKPPKEHLPDLLEDKLSGEDSDIYIELLVNIFEQKDKVNPKFTIDKAQDFVSLQKLKKGILRAASLIEAGDENSIHKAKQVILESVDNSIDAFSPGTILSSGSAISFLFEDQNEDVFPTGIKELDMQGIGPIRGGLYVFMAVYGAGKTFHLVHLGKMAMISGLKVCHITLEMSEQRISSRWHQALFGIPRRNLESHVFRFTTKDGKYNNIDSEKLKFPASIKDVDQIIPILKKERKLHRRFLKNVVIKQFPTGSLTIEQLKAYLDMLAAKGFVPDMIIIDYADIMHVDPKNYRRELGKIYEDLRGIAVDRNIAMVTASQANRESLSRKKVTGKNIAEDFSKLATADFVITYSQTEAERKFKLARIYVDKARDEASHQTILISQDYERGQFIVDSCLIDDKYWEDIQSMEEE